MFGDSVAFVRGLRPVGRLYPTSSARQVMCTLPPSGNCWSLALYARYRQTGGDFPEKYLAMLTAAAQDSRTPSSPLGVDLTDLTFWHGGLSILADLVAEAEKLAAAA